ncbi:hypothetical protein AVEN_200394-1, partial [Araneus ventricosus]
LHELSGDYVTSYVMKSLPVEKVLDQASSQAKKSQLDFDQQASWWANKKALSAVLRCNGNLYCEIYKCCFKTCATFLCLEYL